MVTETDEVAHRYSRRALVGKDERYSMLRPEVWRGSQERQRELIRVFARHVRRPLDQLKLLEIGCGAGSNLLELIGLGFDPANLTANELLLERVAKARHNLPASCTVLAGDACALNLPENSFDIVYQSTVFTSILDKNFQNKLAMCMWQWVKPGGGVLWYDFIYSNPQNPDVCGVSTSRVKELFPEGKPIIRRVTLAPPISRRVCKVHPFAYHVFNAVPWLRTHILCWIGKKSRDL